MRCLILLRHAKAETDAPSGKDHDRRLDERGRLDAAAIGEWLAEHKLVPDQALVSTAMRTRQSWEILSGALARREPPPAAFLPDLYNATASHLLMAIHDVAAGVERLMLVGHNPGLQELALGLTCRSDAAERRVLAGNMPTSAVAVIDFPIADWADARFGDGRLQLFVSPKMLREAS